MGALPQTAGGVRMPLTRAERRAARRALDRDMRNARAEARRQGRAGRAADRRERDQARDVRRALRERDRELADRSEHQRARRRAARGVYDAVGFDRMFRDGTCEVERGLWSETIEFEDMSYQSAREEDQLAAFEGMCRMLDYFDADSMLQFSVMNVPIPDEEVGYRRFFDPERCGENARLAEAYNRILNDKMREGCSNIRRRRLLTYATAAEGPAEAARTLARMRSSALQSLASLRSRGRVLDGHDRLEAICQVLRPEGRLAFDYDRDLSSRSPLTAKDFVCPTALDFRPGGDPTCYRSDGTWCQVLAMRESMGSEIDDRVVSNALDLPFPLCVTWHLQPIDKAKAEAMVRRQAAWIQKEVIDNQRQALRQGYDYTILPPELEDVRAENEKVLEHLRHRNQRLYYFTGLVFTWAPTREQLRDQVVELVRTMRQRGIELSTLDLRQREAMNSVLPLAHNHVDVSRDLETAEAAVFMPFTTQELDQPGGGYYGQNRISGNLVICDRKSLMSPHGFICGMSGSGKSFAVKREIENTILETERDRIFIMDVTGEYGHLVRANHGAELAYGPDSTTHSNPFDVADVEGMTWQAALAWKTDAVIAMTSALKAEGSQGLTQEERSVVTAAVEESYRRVRERTGPLACPTLGDFVESLRATEEGRGRSHALGLALAFDRYVSGPFSFLNHQSNADLNASRVVSFNTREVPSDMRVLTMLANLETVRNRMYRNHELGVATWLYIDEVQSLFGHPAVITYLARLWREGRKYGLICTGMTQSASAMGAGGEAAAIMEQSGFLLLLRQSDADRRFWVESRGLSEREAACIDDTARPGQGLLIADAARVPITDDFPRGNELYEMFDTTPRGAGRADA